MKRPHLLLVSFSLLTSLLALVAFRVPQEDLLQRIITQLANFYIGSFPEKSYLHFDKRAYATGETMWFSAYVVDGAAHQPDTLSRVLYVDLIAPDKRLVTHQVLRLEKGRAVGDFALSDTLPQGMYLVRAYTNWMRNFSPGFFHSQRFPVWQTEPGSNSTGTAATKRRASKAPAPQPTSEATKIDVQFFPEGGSLVSGLESQVGFKVTDAYGRGVEATGQVQDEQGNTVASFKSLHAGMGVFRLQPETGKRYKAKVTLANGTQSEYALPAASETGFVMKVTQSSEHVYLGVQGKAAGTGEIALVAHVRGYTAYAAKGQVTANQGIALRIAKSKFPTGIAHFTLFDGQGNARCERLSFVDAQPSLQVKITPDKAVYAPREKVNLNVAITDATGKPVAAQLSLAVTSTQQLTSAANTGNIRTHLLLTSDLQGYVEEPGYYFKDNQPETLQALDNLLLTQGWRRFVWKEVLDAKISPRPFALEQTLSVGGVVLRGDKPAPNSQLTIFKSKPTRETIAATTDADGSFVVGGFNGRDSANVVVQAKTSKGNRNLLIKLQPRWPDIPPLSFPMPPSNPPEVADYLQRSKKQQAVEQQFRPDSTKTIMLRGVTVKGSKAPELKPDPRRLHSRADAVIKPDDIPGSSSYSSVLQALQGRVAGLTVTGAPPNMQVQIRGSGSPTFILDGILVDADAINSIPPIIVESIEVLKGPSAAIYGGQGLGGVIAVYTKRGNPNYDYAKEAAPGVVSVAIPAYYQAREFYVPRYESPSTRPVQPDFRSATLYWAPRLTTDAAGRGQLSFYCSEAVGSFGIAVEGLSATGTPGTGTSGFTVAPR